MPHRVRRADERHVKFGRVTVHELIDRTGTATRRINDTVPIPMQRTAEHNDKPLAAPRRKWAFGVPVLALAAGLAGYWLADPADPPRPADSGARPPAPAPYSTTATPPPPRPMTQPAPPPAAVTPPTVSPTAQAEPRERAGVADSAAEPDWQERSREVVDGILDTFEDGVREFPEIPGLPQSW